MKRIALFLIESLALSFVIFFVSLLSPPKSFATACCSAGDCPSGYSCQGAINCPPNYGVCSPPANVHCGSSNPCPSGYYCSALDQTCKPYSGTYGSCFPKGTSVSLSNGNTKNIEDIKVGDIVLSQDESGNQTQSTVQGLENPISNNMCEIKYTSGNSLKVTKGHPLFTQNGWKAIDIGVAAQEDPGIPVSTLNAGDFMKRDKGEWNQISNISCWNDNIQTYNLTVNNAHNYFAGGFLAHNKGCQCGGGWNWSCSKSCPASARNGGFCGYTRNPPIVAKVDCGTYSCYVCPSCGATAPVITSFTPGTSFNMLTINWTPGNVVSGGSQVILGDRILSNIQTGCPAGCDVGATLGSTTSFYTTNALVAGSVYYWEIININSSSCSAASSIKPYMSSCALLPATSTVTLGSSPVLQNSISNNPDTLSLISSVSYSPSNPAVFTVTSPDTTSSNGFTTTATTLTPGTATASSTVNSATYGTLCTSPATINVLSAQPWWQVKDADVETSGDLTSRVFAPNFFDLNGPGGFPGIPIYGGTLGGITSSTVSQTKWLVQTTVTNPKVYNYQYFYNQVPATTTFNAINQGDVVPSKLTDPLAIPDANGYYWFRYNGNSATNSNQPLTIPAVNIGSRKAILFVDSANANITGNINLTYGSGLFMLIVGQNASGTGGTIQISPGVGGGGAANLEGLYVSDSDFVDGTLTPGSNDTKLWVRGSVAANGSAILQRDLGAAGNSNSAELFEYAPDQIMLIPKVLNTHRINWKEVAP